MSAPKWLRGHDMVWTMRVGTDVWTVTEDGWRFVLRRNGEEVGTYASATKAKRAAERLVVVR